MRSQGNRGGGKGGWGGSNEGGGFRVKRNSPPRGGGGGDRWQNDRWEDDNNYGQGNRKGGNRKGGSQGGKGNRKGGKNNQDYGYSRSRNNSRRENSYEDYDDVEDVSPAGASGSRQPASINLQPKKSFRASMGLSSGGFGQGNDDSGGGGGSKSSGVFAGFGGGGGSKSFGGGSGAFGRKRQSAPTFGSKPAEEEEEEWDETWNEEGGEEGEWDENQDWDAPPERPKRKTGGSLLQKTLAMNRESMGRDTRKTSKGPGETAPAGGSSGAFGGFGAPVGGGFGAAVGSNPFASTGGDTGASAAPSFGGFGAGGGFGSAKASPDTSPASRMSSGNPVFGQQAAPPAAPKPIPKLAVVKPRLPAAFSRGRSSLPSAMTQPPAQLRPRARSTGNKAGGDISPGPLVNSGIQAYTPFQETLAAIRDEVAYRSDDESDAEHAKQAEHQIIGEQEVMCTEDEVDERTRSRQISAFERAQDGKNLDPELAVKKYQRSAADKVYSPETTRTLNCCVEVVKYLFTKIASLDVEPDPRYTLPAPSEGKPNGVNTMEVYAFLRDRLRAVRVDLNVQQPLSTCTRSFIEIHELCLRWEILALYLCRGMKKGEGNTENYDPALALKTISSIIEPLLNSYSEVQNKGGFNSPCIAIIHRFIILAMLGSGQLEQLSHIQKLDRRIRRHPLVRGAVKFFAAWANHNYLGFLKLYEEADFLTATLISPIVDLCRFRLLWQLVRTCNKQGDTYTLTELQHVMKLYDATQAEELFTFYGLLVQQSDEHGGQKTVTFPFRDGKQHWSLAEWPEDLKESFQKHLYNPEFPSTIPRKGGWVVYRDAILTKKFEDTDKSRSQVVYGEADPKPEPSPKSKGGSSSPAAFNIPPVKSTPFSPPKIDGPKKESTPVSSKNVFAAGQDTSVNPFGAQPEITPPLPKEPGEGSMFGTGSTKRRRSVTDLPPGVQPPLRAGQPPPTATTQPTQIFELEKGIIPTPETGSGNASPSAGVPISSFGVVKQPSASPSSATTKSPLNLVGPNNPFGAPPGKIAAQPTSSPLATGVNVKGRMSVGSVMSPTGEDVRSPLGQLPTGIPMRSPPGTQTKSPQFGLSPTGTAEAGQTSPLGQTLSPGEISHIMDSHRKSASPGGLPGRIAGLSPHLKGNLDGRFLKSPSAAVEFAEDDELQLVAPAVPSSLEHATPRLTPDERREQQRKVNIIRAHHHRVRKFFNHWRVAAKDAASWKKWGSLAPSISTQPGGGVRSRAIRSRKRQLSVGGSVGSPRSPNRRASNAFAAMLPRDASAVYRFACILPPQLDADSEARYHTNRIVMSIITELEQSMTRSPGQSAKRSRRQSDGTGRIETILRGDDVQTKSLDGWQAALMNKGSNVSGWCFRPNPTMANPRQSTDFVVWDTMWGDWSGAIFCLSKPIGQADIQNANFWRQEQARFQAFQKVNDYTREIRVQLGAPPRSGLPVAICVMTTSIQHPRALDSIKKWFDGSRNPTRYFVVGNLAEGNYNWNGISEVMRWFAKNARAAWYQAPCHHANEMEIRTAIHQSCKLLEARGISAADAWRRSVESVSAVIGKELTSLPPSEWKDRSSHFSSSLQALQHLASLQQMPRMGQLFPAHLEYGLPFPSSWAVDLEPELENISSFNRPLALGV